MTCCWLSLQVNQVLNKARDDAGRYAQASLRDTNNVVRMVTAGSKVRLRFADLRCPPELLVDVYRSAAAHLSECPSLSQFRMSSANAAWAGC